MAYDVQQLLKMSQADLDDLFTKSPPGPIPTGEAKGTAIVAPGMCDGSLAMRVPTTVISSENGPDNRSSSTSGAPSATCTDRRICGVRSPLPRKLKL